MIKNKFIYFGIFITVFFCNKRDQIESGDILIEEKNLGKYEENKENHKKLQVVLIHGIAHNNIVWEKIKEIQDILAGIEKIYPNKDIKYIIVPLLDSLDTPIRENYKNVVKRIKSHRDYDKEVNTIVFGHSQGGLYSFVICKHEWVDMKIKALITVGTPWEGAQIAVPDKANSLFYNFIKKKSQESFKPCYLGVVDVLPNSDFINWVRKELPALKVPIYMIGCQSDYANSLPKLSILKNDTIRKTIGLDEDVIIKLIGSRESDGMITLQSQLAMNTETKAKRIKIKKKCIHSPLVRSKSTVVFTTILRRIGMEGTASEIENIPQEPTELGCDEVHREIASIISNTYNSL